MQKPANDLALDETRHLATLHGQKIDLTALEFNLLHVFLQHPGRTYSRSQLMDRIYSDRRVVKEYTIDNHIKKLRIKIAAVAPDVKLIHTVYGTGFKLEYSV